MSEHATEHRATPDSSNGASVAGRAYHEPALSTPRSHQAQLEGRGGPAAYAASDPLQLPRRYDVPRYLYLIAAKGHRARRKEMQMTRYERVAWRALRDPSRFEARLQS